MTFIMSLLEVILVPLFWSYIFAQSATDLLPELSTSQQWDLPKISCSDYFYYVIDRHADSVYGIVLMREPTATDDYKFAIGLNMTVDATIAQNDGLKLQILFNEGQLLFRENIIFQIYFPQSAGNKVPWLNQLRVNDRVVCNASPPPLNPHVNRTSLWATAKIEVVQENLKHVNANLHGRSSFSFIVNRNSASNSGHSFPNVMAMVESGGTYNLSPRDTESYSIGLFSSPHLFDLNADTHTYRTGSQPAVRSTGDSPLSGMAQIFMNPFSDLEYPLKNPPTPRYHSNDSPVENASDNPVEQEKNADDLNKHAENADGDVYSPNAGT